MKQFRRFLAGFAAAALICVGGTGAASAASQAVIQSYGTDGSVQPGMIVRLQDKKSTAVTALEADRATAMLGVAVNASDAALRLNTSQDSGSVYVATSGRYTTLVSTQNGQIKIGDYITISSLRGIGMKAGTSQKVVVGRAVSNFSGTGNVVGTASLKSADGRSVQVSFGRVMVEVGVQRNPLLTEEHLPGYLGVLKNFSGGIAGKPVSLPRLYLALTVLLVSVIIAGILLYSSPRSAILAIGRNPLAKKTILKGMFEGVATSIIIFVLGLFAVYLLLKL